uniref:NADH dehydrogenase subunit 4L n=1 Tax=Pseudodendrothrips mori TaxID=1291231 RepID=A0A7M3T2A1_9NEOP|nr:NADH dehydrogenase subunit 4L [Pseudodendrothrips mori]QFO91095.1 NADH dehydrogenase subunit 4L [Pseudodendrothrips mori]
MSFMISFFFLSFTFVFFSFFFNFFSFLNSLLIMECLSLMILFNLFLFLYLFCSLKFLMIYLVFIVSEGALGLSVLVKFVKFYGTNNFFSLNLSLF